MSAKILVTGSSGYLGSVLTEKLAQAGFDILALDVRKPNFSGAGKITWLEGDCSDTSVLRQSLAKADIIIPLAALVGTPACAKDPERAKHVNYEAIKLINSLRSPRQQVLFPMTNNGYSPKPGQTTADESCPFKTDSIYTLTKFQAEQDLLNKGNAISLRLASLFGASPKFRWDLLVHTFVREALEKGTLKLFEGGFKRSFVHLADAVDAFVFSAQNFQKMRDQIYNVALASANLTKQELAEEVRKQIPSLKIEMDLANQDPDKRDFFISTEKISKAGFNTKKTLPEGITEVIEAFKKLKGA